MTLTKHGKAFLASVFAMALALCLPTAAWATIEEGDQSSPTDEEIAAAVEAGIVPSSPTETAEESLPLVALGAQDTINLATQVSCPYAITEYSGENMFETAVAEAKAAYPSGSTTAVIVGSGDAWVDALAAAGLAASKGPILFTWQDGLHETTAAALKDLGVKSVVIIGGTAAVGEQVEADLKEAGISVEARLGGKNCYDTQLKIFEYGLENDLWNGDLAIVATGAWFGDALSVSPVAYAQKAPIFLVDSKGVLNDDQKNAWKKAAQEKGFAKDVTLVGGPAVVSQKTIDFANEMVDLAGGTNEALWRYGANQYETSSAVADWAVGTYGFSWNNVAFTTGTQPYDALAGSVLQGTSKSVMLLADSAYSQSIDWAYQNRSGVSAMRFFGGKRALTSNTRIGIADKFGFSYAAIPNFKLYLDAGHGWNDMNNGVFAGGASTDEYEEYDLNCELAGKVADILRNEYGVNLFLNDDGGPYRYRHAEAVAEGCDMIVSIHFNAGGGSGTLMLVHSYNNAEMSWALANEIHPYLIEGTSLNDYGIRGQEVAILGGELPATLLEIAFIDNWYDMSTYQERKDYVARKIAEGIVA